MDSVLPETSTIYDLWRLHPRGDYFIARGGDHIPPPRRMELTLTNKCNLRCEICGSQKTLDKTKTPRSHMPFSMFQQIAETVFPFLTEVELNSRGDPLLYPQIEEVLDTLVQHKCAYRIQHNGTLLTDSIIERLANNHGMVSLSIDAVGPLFDQVRRHGIWEKAEPGLKKLAAVRDKTRVYLMLYPTVTQRTVNHLFDIILWAHEHKIDCVVFHDFDLIDDSTETKPDKNEKERQFEKIANFLSKENAALKVYDDSRLIYSHPSIKIQPDMPSPLKEKYGIRSFNYPLDADHIKADKANLCPVPWQSFGVDIEGQINVCCRTQSYPFGSATSVESFADVWFGENFEKLRHSLMRGSDSHLPLPPCESCIHHYAPKAAKSVESIAYTNNVTEDSQGFIYERPEANLTFVLRETPIHFGYKGCIPLGLNPSQYELYEDNKLLGPVCSYNDVLAIGEGRYSFKDNTVCFSSSDNSNPLRNDRKYVLRRKA